MSEYSTITVQQIVSSFLCPVKVYFDDDIIYDDTGDETLDKLESFLNRTVSNFYVDIVQFHHSIIRIYSKGD